MLKTFALFYYVTLVYPVGVYRCWKRGGEEQQIVAAVEALGV